MQLQPLEFKDFSGGMTDFYLGAPLNKFESGNNLMIVKHGNIGKLATRQGSELYDSTYYQVPAGAQRVGTLKYFDSTLFYHSSRNVYYVDAGWHTLVGPVTSNLAFPVGVDTTTVVSMATWNHHLFFTSSDLTQKVQKIYKDGSSVWQMRTAGMPALASSPVATGGTPGTTKSYLYRFLYYYTYTVGTVVYEDRGPTTEVAVTNTTAIAAGAGNTISWASIPVLANGAIYNYSTATIKVEMYRTTDGGSNFFFVSSVTNGVTTTTDTTTDAVLQNHDPLYTEGGAPENTEPPLCKLVHVVGNRGFYANVKDGAELRSNRFYQSVPNDIDSVPATFYEEIDDEITGMSSVHNSPILLCANGPVYRVDGFIDEVGLGFLDPQKISATAGCISSMSVVQTLTHIFWAGIDGFYGSDGYAVLRLSDGIRDTYKSLVSTAARKRRIVGKYDATENRVWWAVQQGSSATDSDSCFVLDLNWGVSTDMPFTTVSGGVNFNPTAIEFVGANLVRGDKSGYTFIHRSTLYVDPKIDTGVVPSSWTSATIVYDLLTVATDFGTSYMRKWVSNVSVVCKNETNLSLQITSINDDGRRTGDLKPIRFRGNVTWGDPDLYWGDPDLTWNSQGLIDETRRMPAGGLRCEYKQLEFTNAKVVITSSDVIGTAVISGAANTATLTNTASFDWPTAAVDYLLAFDVDGYVKEYVVTARTDDVLTFADPDATAPTEAAAKWVMRGYQKGEVLSLLSFVLSYSIIGSTQKPFHSSGTGEVGASG